MQFKLCESGTPPYASKNFFVPFFSFRPRCNERRICRLIRYLFETIQSLCLLALLIPPLSLYFCYIVLHRHLGTSRATCTIGNNTIALTDATLQLHLRSALEKASTYKQITISHDERSTPLQLSRPAAKLLKQLLPQHIALQNFVLCSKKILKALETKNTYYERAHISHEEPSCQKLLLKRKVDKIILPQNPSAVVEELQRIRALRQRISILYFTSYIPPEFEEEIAILTSKIAPEMQCMVADGGDKDFKEITLLLNSFS